MTKERQKRGEERGTKTQRKHRKYNKVTETGEEAERNECMGEEKYMEAEEEAKNRKKEEEKKRRKKKQKTQQVKSQIGMSAWEKIKIR